jgi:broad specificity phosphatase PhoE
MVYFVRHGSRDFSTDYNEHYNRELDIMDDPLNEKGKADALRLASHFSSIDIKRIIVSEYKRTYQTALPAAEQKGLPIVTDRRVNEINNGVLRNMPDGEVAEKYPQVWSDFTRHVRDVRFPGGESGEDVKTRQDSFLNDIKTEQDDILVVSHDGFIRLLMCNILGLPVYQRHRFKTYMGGLSAVKYDAGKGEWSIITFNQPI